MPTSLTIQTMKTQLCFSKEALLVLHFCLYSLSQNIVMVSSISLHQGLLLALSSGAGAEHWVYPGHTSVQRRGGEPGQMHSWSRKHSPAGKEAHRRTYWTRIQFCGYSGAKSHAALQHPTDCILSHQHGSQWQGKIANWKLQKFLLGFILQMQYTHY